MAIILDGDAATALISAKCCRYLDQVVVMSVRGALPAATAEAIRSQLRAWTCSIRAAEPVVGYLPLAVYDYPSIRIWNRICTRQR